MKRTLLLFISIVALSSMANAQLKLDTFSRSLHVINDVEGYSLRLIFAQETLHDKYQLAPMTKVNIELISGEVIKLHAPINGLQQIDNSARKTGQENYYPHRTAGEILYVDMPITIGDLEKIKKGITKIKINTYPEIFEKDFKAPEEAGNILYKGFDALKEFE